MPTSESPVGREQVARSFGVDPARYDRARPPYPRELVDFVVAAAPGPDLLDVGCGTGIEARQFQAAGRRVLGVDPDPRMAAHARATGVEVEVAAFEDWDPAGRRYDAVVAGQSWHWVDPAAGLAQAARALRPGGLLAVLAHAYEPPEPQARALADACRDAAGVDLPQPAPGVYRAGAEAVAETLRRADAFGDPEVREWRWEREYARDEWCDLMATTGLLTRLPPDVLAAVLDRAGAAVDGSFLMPYTTFSVTAVRSGAE